MDAARQKSEISTAKRASLLGYPYHVTANGEPKNMIEGVMSNNIMYTFKIVPLEFGKGFATFGITPTSPQQVFEYIGKNFSDQRTSFEIMSEEGFKEYMVLYDPPKKIEYQDITLSTAGEQELIAEITKTLQEVKPDDILAYLVKQAHHLNASDIHIENQRENVRIRFRIDGVLHPIAELSPDKYRTLQSTIAIAGNVSTSDPEPQQGHISQDVTMADESMVRLNLRLETMPTIHGMDVVMRLFQLDEGMYTLDKLGLSEKERGVVDNIISKPSGLVMVVGPTGSGKTTTLYSMLQSLNTSERKLITLEDPVEYQFAGIMQVSLNTKSTKEVQFADHLRAVLRLDPDVIMVGEIRDMDTARTALQAALTGHLVLATFHASSAAAALARLFDIVEENPLFLSAIRLIMAQRLIRKLDDTSKTEQVLDDTLKQTVGDIIAGLPPDLKKPDINATQFYEPGSSKDNPYGFSGQIAVREQCTMSPGIIELLKTSGRKASAQDIEAAAIKDGMTTMQQDGILKAFTGITSLGEVFRVIG